MNNFLYNICFLVLTFFLKIINAIRLKFWRVYSFLYLKSKKIKFSDITFYGRCYIHIESNAYVEFGKNFICRSEITNQIDNNLICKIVVEKNASLIIGNNSGISSTVIYVKQNISIGNYVKIGAGCLIIDSNFHSLEWRNRMVYEMDYNDTKSEQIIIEDNAFIGARCIITKGVIIGKNSIVATGSVVIKSIPDNEIWGGNPAVFIRKIK